MKPREKSRPTVTSRSRIIQAVRLLWLRSSERAAALKRDGYTCQDCNRKQTMAKGKEFKVQVDHLSESINWDNVVEYIRRHVLVSPDELETVCKACHEIRTELRKRIGEIKADFKPDIV